MKKLINLLFVLLPLFMFGQDTVSYWYSYDHYLHSKKMSSLFTYGGVDFTRTNYAPNGEEYNCMCSNGPRNCCENFTDSEMVCMTVDGKIVADVKVKLNSKPERPEWLISETPFTEYWDLIISPTILGENKTMRFSRAKSKVVFEGKVVMTDSLAIDWVLKYFNAMVPKSIESKQLISTESISIDFMDSLVIPRVVKDTILVPALCNNSRAVYGTFQNSEKLVGSEVYFTRKYLERTLEERTFYSYDFVSPQKYGRWADEINNSGKYYYEIVSTRWLEDVEGCYRLIPLKK